MLATAGHGLHCPLSSLITRPCNTSAGNVSGRRGAGSRGKSSLSQVLAAGRAWLLEASTQQGMLVCIEKAVLMLWRIRITCGFSGHPRPVACWCRNSHPTTLKTVKEDHSIARDVYCRWLQLQCSSHGCHRSTGFRAVQVDTIDCNHNRDRNQRQSSDSERYRRTE